MVWEGGEDMRLSRWHYRRERLPLRGVLRYNRRFLMRRAMRGAAGTTSRRCRTAEEEAFFGLLDFLECEAFAPLPASGPYFLGILGAIEEAGA